METEIPIERDAVLFIVVYGALSLLGLIPLISTIFSIIAAIILFYIFHFLNKDLHKHDVYDKALWGEVDSGLKKLGKSLKSLPISNIGRFPDRSTILYIVLSIVTLGLFMLYWVYTLTKDPNVHFKSHVEVEDEFLRIME